MATGCEQELDNEAYKGHTKACGARRNMELAGFMWLLGGEPQEQTAGRKSLAPTPFRHCMGYSNHKTSSF